MEENTIFFPLLKQLEEQKKNVISSSCPEVQTAQYFRVMQFTQDVSDKQHKATIQCIVEQGI
jgi:hypothetical protein